MANIFNSIQLKKVQSNSFDMSYDMKLSLNMGDLVPIHCQEIVPGDRITMNTESMLRFAPLIAPVMHRVDVYTHFFFVPNRLLWSGWEKFITNDPSAPAFPYLANVIAPTGGLGDYLGLPTDVLLDKISAIPWAAYQMIFHEYYRDQNLQPEFNFKLVDGDNTANSSNLGVIRKRAWQHDYFTAALPFAQKGDAVTIPLGQFDDVNVYYDNNVADYGLLSQHNGGAIATGTLSNGSEGIGDPKGAILDSSGDILDYDPNGTLKAQTSALEAGASTINDLRRAFRLQEWLEKQARGGTRYVESILSHFGVKSSDARLNRPEYLGGSKQPVVISEVLQTSESSATGTPQGNMSGHGISVGGGKQFSYYSEEHGYIIGIMSVMPKTAYQQGIPKHFSKFDPFDFYWPTFAHLGEQEVKNRELYYAPGDTSNDEVFGYIPRYSEYRYHDNRVAGDFRSSLSYWHLGRIFTTRPHLNDNFVECRPTHRIFAVEDDPNTDTIYAHVFHRIKAVRKMPKYGTPDF